MLSWYNWSFFICFSLTTASSKRPNILFFLTDDWGYNDVGYHDNTNTKTPFLDNLALEEGLIIEKYYGMHICSVSRSCLLTGRYPMRFGFQSDVIGYESKWALTQREKLLPEEFKNAGYSTHLVGKYHLGHLTPAYTPTRRGFDTFTGYYGGQVGYWEYTGLDPTYTAYDLRHGTADTVEKPFFPPLAEGVYSLDLWMYHVLSILEDRSISHDESPFFLYVGWQGSHIPSQAPDDFVDIYKEGLNNSEISSKSKRLCFQAQTTMTDTLLERLVTQLKSSGTWDNTLLVIASDNGGQHSIGDNSPLRGAKSTIWEGGVKLPAFITGGYLDPSLRGTTFDSYPVHTADWYPTLLAAAGLDVSLKPKSALDGMNLWNLLQTAQKRNTREYQRLDAFSNSISTLLTTGSGQPITNNQYITNNNHKINTNQHNSDIQITTQWAEKIHNNYNHNDNINNQGISQFESEEVKDWYIKELTEEYIFEETHELFKGDIEELTKVTKERVILINANRNGCNNEVCGALIYGGRWKIVYSDNELEKFCHWTRSFSLNEFDILGCRNIPDDVNTTDCPCTNEPCLFDLRNDPCEYYDISENNPELTEKLLVKLKEYYDIQAGPLDEYIGDITNASDINPTNNSINGTASFWGPYMTNLDWETIEFEQYLAPWYDRYNMEENIENENKEVRLSLNVKRLIRNMWSELGLNGMLMLFMATLVCCILTMFCLIVRKRDNSSVDLVNGQQNSLSINIGHMSETIPLLFDKSGLSFESVPSYHGSNGVGYV